MAAVRGGWDGVSNKWGKYDAQLIRWLKVCTSNDLHCKFMPCCKHTHTHRDCVALLTVQAVSKRNSTALQIVHDFLIRTALMPWQRVNKLNFKLCHRWRKRKETQNKFVCTVGRFELIRWLFLINLHQFLPPFFSASNTIAVNSNLACVSNSLLSPHTL